MVWKFLLELAPFESLIIIQDKARATDNTSLGKRPRPSRMQNSIKLERLAGQLIVSWGLPSIYRQRNGQRTWECCFTQCIATFLRHNKIPNHLRTNFSLLNQVRSSWILVKFMKQPK